MHWVDIYPFPSVTCDVTFSRLALIFICNADPEPGVPSYGQDQATSWVTSRMMSCAGRVAVGKPTSCGVRQRHPCVKPTTYIRLWMLPTCWRACTALLAACSRSTADA